MHHQLPCAPVLSHYIASAGSTADFLWSIQFTTAAGETVLDASVGCTPPIAPPRIAELVALEGCAADGADMLCDAAGAAFKILGDRFSHRNVTATLLPVQGAVGPAPLCSLEAAASDVVCRFSAAARTYGCWNLELASIVPGGGSGKSSARHENPLLYVHYVPIHKAPKTLSLSPLSAPFPPFTLCV